MLSHAVKLDQRLQSLQNAILPERYSVTLRYIFKGYLPISLKITTGQIFITDAGDGTATFNGVISGLPLTANAQKHGFHIHEKGDLSDNCQAAGGHFNPDEVTLYKHGSEVDPLKCWNNIGFQVNHGGPASSERHVGDLGNIIAIGGASYVTITDTMALLQGQPDKSVRLDIKNPMIQFLRFLFCSRFWDDPS